MDYKSEKKRFFDTLVSQNPPVTPKEFPTFAANEAPAVPEAIRDKWGKRYYANPGKLDFTYEPRLVNHFCLGADPEYFFVANERYAHAIHIDATISTLRAFGCDITGRQAELRAYASPSILKVVASLVDAMRGMITLHPATWVYNWVAQAILDNDGAGGHIHFGRLRKWKTDIKSLDSLSTVLAKSTIIDKSGSEIRRATTNYGKLGDYRLQPHGFEYRTLPTWLDSIWAAFLTLTLAKLCILCQIPNIHANGSRILIENLLRRFQHEDDDAKLALKVLLRQGLPVFIGDDFKARWGVPSALYNPLLERLFFPSSIKPHPSTIKEVWTHLEEGLPMKARPLIPTWNPYCLPWDLNTLGIRPHEPGTPEISSNLLSKGQYPVNVVLVGANQGYITAPVGFHYNHKLAKELDIKVLLQSKEPGNQRITLYVPTSIQRNYVVDKGKVKHYRSILTSGLLPVAHYTKINEVDVEQYYSKKKPISCKGQVFAMKGGIVGPEQTPMADWVSQAQQDLARNNIVANQPVVQWDELVRNAENQFRRGR